MTICRAWQRTPRACARYCAMLSRSEKSPCAGAFCKSVASASSKQARSRRRQVVYGKWRVSMPPGEKSTSGSAAPSAFAAGWAGSAAAGSRGSISQTKKPRLGRLSTNPSETSWLYALSTVVTLTPRCPARLRLLGSLAWAGSAPVRICCFRWRVIWIYSGVWLSFGGREMSMGASLLLAL